MKNAIKTTISKWLGGVARGLNKLTRGRLSPDFVTIFGLLAHIPIAVLIATGHFVWAGIFLIIFGLFDKLDGELARLQSTASRRGMLLDASTDRMKEVFLYIGVSYWFTTTDSPSSAVWAVAACGASLCVSYVKAKGEAAVASGGQKIPHATLNYMFGDGFFSFEIRMTILLLGLFTGYLVLAVAVVVAGSTYTALQRLVRISRRLA